MKTLYWILIGLFIGFSGLFVLLINLSETVNEFEQENIKVIEQALNIEITQESRICNKYSIDNGIIKLWCIDDLTTSGQHTVMSRIFGNTKGKLKGKVVYDIWFKSIKTEKNLNAFYDYTFSS